LTLRAEAKLFDFFNFHYREAKETHYSVSFEDNELEVRAVSTTG
jgi:hypothetical protein